MTTNPASGSDLSPVPVYILAGGQSRRFGSDKARAPHDGVPLIVGVARLLEPVSSRITVVAAREGAYDDLGLRTIGDIVPEKGPLGGLLSAIADCGEDEWLFLAACDWVGIRAEWVSLLLEQRTPEARAVVYKSERYEPLFALYHTSIRETVVGLIEANRLETRNIFKETATVTMPPPEGWSDAVNLNRPPQ